MLKKTLVVFMCLCWGSFFSQDFYGVWYGINANILNKESLQSCSVQPLAICQPSVEPPYSGDPPYLDMAADRDYLYFVTPLGVLYRQNLSGPLNCQVLGSFGCFVNSLVADSAGTLYAIGKDSGLTFYLLKYSANTFSNLGALPSPYKPTGDLFFYEHRLFLTTYSTSPNPLLPDDNFLMNIDMNTPSLSCIYMPLPVPIGYGYWGAFSLWDGTQSHAFIQVNTGIQEIDMKCKSLSAATCTILASGCRGFASWYPFTSSNSAANCNTETLSLTASETQLCQGETATLTAYGWGTYTWSVPGNQSSIAVTPSATTVYSISGTNALGCLTSSTATIYVSNCVDLEEWTDKSMLTVYPNPGKGPFECVSDAPIRDVMVFDELGREVKRISNSGTRVILQDLRPGIYFLLLNIRQETLRIKLVVLE